MSTNKILVAFLWLVGVPVFLVVYIVGLIPSIFSGYFRQRLAERARAFGWIITNADDPPEKRNPYPLEREGGEPEPLMALWELIVDSWRELGITLGAAGVFAGLALFIAAVVLPGFNLGATTEQQPVPELGTPAPLQGTERDQFMAQYGPWFTTEEALALRKEPGIRNLAFVNTDGNVRYSIQTFAFSGGSPWEPLRPPEITALRVEGSAVILRTNMGREITLNVTQPFVIEGRVKTVYLVDRAGELFGAALEELVPYEAAQSQDPSITPNPNLSVLGN